MAAGQMAVLGKVLEAQVTRHLRPCVGAFDSCRRDIHGGLVASKPAPESTAPKLGPVGTASFDDFGSGSFLAADQATCSADPLNLEDTERLYSALSTGELAKGVFNLSLVGSSLLVDASSKLLMSDLMKNKLLAAPVNWVVRRTAYSHFCAGGTIEEAKATLLRTSELGLRSILDYSVEDAMDSATCDKNLAGNLETLRHVASLPRHCSSHSVVKITSFVPLPVLERASALLRWQHQHPSVDLPWKRPSFPMLAPGSILPAQAEPAPLSPEEVQSLEACLERLRAVCRACHGLHLPLLIDAEYFSVQPAIDYLAGVAALEFNREFPLVVNTFQCYLKDALPRLQLAIQAARRADVSFAAKLVRGAYIVKETQRAAEGSYENPIQAGIDSTHANYDRCATLMLETAARGARRNAVVLASHNVASVRRAIGTADALGLARKDERLQFAQLKGMADALSLAIGHAGYLCSKLHPFGSVEETLPYLIRRAQENKGMLMQAGTDRARLQHELLRRIRSSLGLA